MNFWNRLSFLSAGMEFLVSPRHQRSALKAGSTEHNRILLFGGNADFINADENRWYYYDPHGIRYTGIRKILKGWCGSVGKIARVHCQDFIHTSSGDPVFFKIFDNYYDVTWEKGYRYDGWKNDLPVLHFRTSRYRNSFQDTISSEFNCIRYPFEKIPGYDRIIVRARADGKEDLEVSVLINGDVFSTEEAVTAIFSRWVQECDFLYEIRHFGLNQITSYDFEDYGSLEESLLEKAVESNEYIVRKLRREALNGELKKLLLKKENVLDSGEALREVDSLRMNALKEKLAEITGVMGRMEKKCSKEDKLIEEGAQKLNTVPKQYMDIVKITARNIFFRQFKSFRPLYGNFRNDHVMLRELTRAPGFVLADEKRMTVFLCPAITVQPKVRENIQLFLDQASADIGELKGRKLEFRLWSKDIREAKRGILFAIVRISPQPQSTEGWSVFRRCGNSSRRTKKQWR